MTARLLAVPYRVPYYAQIASPWLAAPFFEGKLNPALDPHWRESGAYALEEYLYWIDRACGAACVKMAVEALGGERLPLIEWARRGVRLGGYLSERRPDGHLVERGWLHRALAELICEAGFSAEARPLSIHEFISIIGEGGMIIASVSPEIGAGSPITQRGGHLVLVFGAILEKNEPLALLLHNPSGRSDALRVSAQIPLERFASAYSGRAIVVKASSSA